MGFLSELKKLFFAGESVAKSGAGKAVDASKELGEDLVNKGGDLFDKAKGTTSELGGDLLEKAGDLGSDLKDKAGDLLGGVTGTAGGVLGNLTEKASELGENLVEKTAPLADKTKEMAANLGEKVAPVVDKGKDIAENVGSKVIETGGEAWDKTKDVSENVGSKILDVGGDMVDKAKEVGSDLKDKADAVIDRSEKIASGEEEMKTVSDYAKDFNEKINKPPEFSEKVGYDEHKGSLLDGQDDFFAKAEKYADGDNNAFNTTNPTDLNTTPPTPQIESSEEELQLPAGDEKIPFEGDVKGFFIIGWSCSRGIVEET